MPSIGKAGKIEEGHQIDYGKAMAFLLPTIRAVSGTPDSSVTLPEDQQIVSMVGCFMNCQPLASSHLTASPSSGSADWGPPPQWVISVSQRRCRTKVAGQREGGIS